TQIGTGNYNEKTAKLYTDLSLITADPQIGRDAADFFLNMSLSNRKGEYRTLWIAPNGFKQNVLRMIDGEIAKARAGKPCGILMKCNSMTDKIVMEKLAQASKANVPIKLIVRGICCLLPGIPGETDNIEIISIVGRFLEHSRVYCFGDGEETAVYIGSGDMMTRNTDKRVEIAAPVKDVKLKRQILRMMEILLRDNVKAREMHSDGSYTLRTPDGQRPLCAQEEFILRAEAAAPAESGKSRSIGELFAGVRRKLPFRRGKR
ncbi:MAG: RNA degradosome polyphosphate kinase, partial [Clostridiales bacterium]